MRSNNSSVKAFGTTTAHAQAAAKSHASAPVQSSKITLGPNLYALPKADVEQHRENGHVPFRFSDGQEFAFFKKNPEADFTDLEICKINLMCDKHEGSKNRDIKAILNTTLSRHFKAVSEHQLIEFGAGRHPLAKMLDKATYHAVEVDPAIITELKKSGYSASTIKTIPGGTLRTDCPRVSAGVYMMHFWDPQNIAEDIKKVISQDGFFVGNYMNGEKEFREVRTMQRLAALRAGGLEVSIVRQNEKAKPSSLGSEFWVVSYPSQKNGMRSQGALFGNTLAHHLQKSLPDENWIKPRTYEAL